MSTGPLIDAWISYESFSSGSDSIPSRGLVWNSFKSSIILLEILLTFWFYVLINLSIEKLSALLLFQLSICFKLEKVHWLT
jgi:hypothetical protein